MTMGLMRYCVCCKNTKQILDFNLRSKTFQKRCRDCVILQKATKNRPFIEDSVTQRKAARAFVMAKKRELGRQCADCRGRFPSYCFDFDHIEAADKRFEISAMARDGMAVERIASEIAKCEMVCANCHRIRTQKRINDAKREKANRKSPVLDS